MYKETFFRHFNYQLNTKEDVVILGGGAGYNSKTVMYSLFGKDEGLKMTAQCMEAQFNGKHRRDISMGVSPHICKVADYNGKRLHMGACQLIIED